MKLLIRQGRLVDPVGGTGGIMDVLVEDGKVAIIESSVNEPDVRVIDVQELTVCTELMDMHVHLQEPDFECRGTIETGAAVMAHGGLTPTACISNVRPATDSPEQITFAKQRTAETCGVHVWPVGAVTRGQQEQELTDSGTLKGVGAVALSDDGMLVQDINLIRDGLILIHRQDLMILSHREDADIMKNCTVNEGRISHQLRLAGRLAIAEGLMMARDAMLVEETGRAVHICYVSTTKPMTLVRRYKRKGVQVACGTCPQYFSLTEDEVLAQNALARVGLPLRTKADVRATIEGLKDGTIDTTAIDHAPRSAEEKTRLLTDAPSDMVDLETVPTVALTHLYHTGEMTLSDILRQTTINPVCILRLPTRGRLAIGSDDDVVIPDPDEAWAVDLNRFASKGRNTPFTGKTLRGKMKYTIIGGGIVCWEGE